MKFKAKGLEAEYAKLHPDVSYVLDELDAWSIARNMPEVVVTCVNRDEKTNKAVAGVPRSWHLFSCAADIRVHHYTPEERADVMKWLAIYCEAPIWELLLHDAGSGDHIHVAKKDFSWRHTFDKRPARA